MAERFYELILRSKSKQQIKQAGPKSRSKEHLMFDDAFIIKEQGRIDFRQRTVVDTFFHTT